MTRDEALATLIDIASRWLENAEEGLPSRISDAALTNDSEFAALLSKCQDDYERDEAHDVRRGLIAIRMLQTTA